MGHEMQLDLSGHRMTARNGVHGSRSAPTVDIAVIRFSNAGALFTSRLVNIFGFELKRHNPVEISHQSRNRTQRFPAEENMNLRSQR